MRRFKVTDRETGEEHWVTEEELAARRPRRRERQYKWPPLPDRLDRDDAIKLIREALKKRSGKAWSVTGGRGTAWGWIRIDAPPARRKYDSEGNPSSSEWGYTSPAEQLELSRLLGLERPEHQGHSVPASSDHYREYVERARGQTPTVYGTQYWD